MSIDAQNGISLFGSDRTEDLSGDDVLRYFASVDADRTIVKALESPGTHLIEGSRGTGKTMLLRFVHEQTNRAPDGRLSIFVSFSRYLASYNPQAKKSKGYSPFQNWLFAKILLAVYDALPTHVLPRGRGAFVGKAPLRKYISRLETHYRDANVSDPAENAKALGVTEGELVDFARPDSTKPQLLSVLDAYYMDSVVLLLDEAAQSFAEELQPEFFQVIKHLRDNRIAIKAAVYPHTTNYGSDFDVGQDAIIHRIERPVEESEGMQFFSAFIEKRFAGTPVFDCLSASPTVRDFLIKMSGGNPRWFIHLLSAAFGADSTSITPTRAAGVVKEFTGTTLWPYLRNLRDRLKSKRRFVDVAEQLLHTFADGLREANSPKKGDTKAKPTCFVSVSSHKAVPFRVHAAIKLLQYAGILSARGPKKISARETAEMYLVHPAVQFRENTLFPAESNPPVERIVGAFTNPLRDQFKEYTRNSPGLVDFGDDENAVGKDCASCGQTVADSDRFCRACGAPIATLSPFEELRAAEVGQLELTPGIKQRLLADARFKVVGDVIDATDAMLDEITMIGPARVKIIRYAAEEFIAG